MNEMSEETRREANEKVDKTKREIQVLQIQKITQILQPFLVLNL